MKMKSKIASFALLSALAAAQIIPASAFAATATSTSQTKFCLKINTYVQDIDGKLGDKVLKLETTQSNRLAKVEHNQNDIDAKRAQERTIADKKREDSYGKLYTKATTTEQKAAIQVFASTTEQAVATRKSAIDKAVADFRAGVDKLIGNRQSQASTTVLTYKSAVDAALAKAKADCASGVADKTIKAQVKADIKTAHEKMTADRKQLEIGTQIKALAATKNTAIENAVKAFKTTMEQAKAALKAAFKK